MYLLTKYILKYARPHARTLLLLLSFLAFRLGAALPLGVSVPHRMSSAPRGLCYLPNLPTFAYRLVVDLIMGEGLRSEHLMVIKSCALRTFNVCL
ncbi:hypothetical protein F5B17DRAFT_385165 [Nemania serpens]|nr:hypothetical protein F5B17DRAFT_385165 [Nemania serpens]